MQPETLGRYKIIKELGRGAMGRVFLAHDPQIDRRVAIKTVQLFDALPERDREEAHERFLREARSAGRLQHPGIVTIFDIGHDAGRSYLAMEYVEGETLDKFCRPDSRLPVATVLEIVARVAEALHFAHQQSVVHRDVKPANVMRVGETAAKIMDFGLATASAGQLTQDGKLFGTPSYMSPEQIRGQQLDGRSDLFSLGVVLFEMLTGEKPFPGDSISSIIYRIVNEDPRDATELEPAVPGPLGAFLRRALAKERDDRFPSGQAFAAALRHAGGMLESSAAQRAAMPATPPAADPAGGFEIEATPQEHRRKRSGIPWIVGIFVLVTALGAGAYILRDELDFLRPPPPPEIWLEAQVRTEPPGVAVELDGVPLNGEERGQVRFRQEGPYGSLTARQGCRVAEHELAPADAGGEIVLVLDPVELDWRVDPGVAGAEAWLNGESRGKAPVDLALDLCTENRIEIKAAGYKAASLLVPSAATPLEARTILAGLELDPLPLGRLVLPESSIPYVYYVDGRRLGRAEKSVELSEGSHTIRFKNDLYWIDRSQQVQVVGGETATPKLRAPALTELVVQAFPGNCKVDLRRPRGKWRYLDDTPLRKKISVGKYEVRVTHNTSGQSKTRAIELVAASNPDVRVSLTGDR